MPALASPDLCRRMFDHKSHWRCNKASQFSTQKKGYFTTQRNTNLWHVYARREKGKGKPISFVRPQWIVSVCKGTFAGWRSEEGEGSSVGGELVVSAACGERESQPTVRTTLVFFFKFHHFLVIWVPLFLALLSSGPDSHTAPSPPLTPFFYFPLTHHVPMLYLSSFLNKKGVSIKKRREDVPWGMLYSWQDENKESSYSSSWS